jgi:gliding motility-associated-like protein
VKASHAMGGEITYTCVGGNSFVFQLVFYRDCNGAEVNTVSENLRVWNHSTITSITLPYVSRQDVSPTCTALPGFASQLECGIGSAGGNGIGAIERVVYRSLPIVLSGIPPADGWIFTYENYSRSNALTNISNPSTYGITLAAKMYAIPGSTGLGCTDSSPQFLQEPYFVSCTGSEYQYNMNAIDPDLDSVHFDFGIPYNHFPGSPYNPPISPNPIVFEPGFSYQNPTPDGTFNASNIPSNINPLTGELTFLSFNSGNYLVKIRVRSFRQGVLISEVEREMQIVVMPCSSANNPPVITPPFSGSFSTTINAGELLTFNLNVVDPEVLQDGVTPQKLYLTASGPMFGAGLTSTTGCDIEPCATLNSAAPIIGTQQVSASFSWQTTCDHLVNQFGIVADVIPYNFVFKVQDDYCPVPKVSYVTITIFVVNPGVIPATQIKCIQTESNGDLTIQWNPVANPSNSFVEYQLNSVEDGAIGVPISNINTTQVTVPAPNSAKHFFVSVRSGCDGNVLKNSDTISNIHLNLINPNNGTAILQWNKPKSTPLSSYNSYYHIYREYPAGTLTLIDSTLYNTTNYKDTIDICEAYLAYKIILPTTQCDFTSNKSGDDFVDMLTPNIPTLLSVGIDTATNAISINWNQNQQPDTYGYVVYTFDDSGFLVELDTVWGWANTSYSYFTDLTQGPFSYSVAAFDSCYTAAVPVTYQTSAKSPIQTTMKIESEVFMCEKKVLLKWTKYGGQSVQEYRIFAKNNGSWDQVASTNDTIIEIPVIGGANYCFTVQAIFSSGSRAFSDLTCFTVPMPQQPSFHYFKLATVENGAIELHDYIDESVGIQEIIFQRLNYTNAYEIIANVPANSNNVFFLDTIADEQEKPWQYRARYVDSCGNIGNPSNIVKTIYLSGVADEIRLLNFIQWTPYEGFDGSIVEYRIYRGPNGVFDSNPIAVVSSNQLSYEDDVSSVEFQGEICYRIEAVEALNFYNFAEISHSNDFCFVYKPLVYIPNTFTPDGDNLNDYFYPILTNIEPLEYNLSIFNRWGQVIFESSKLEMGWDGKIQASGLDATNDTYFYQVQVNDANGVQISKRGFVSLLR